MQKLTPSLRISAALALMSVSLLMVADIFALIPNHNELIVKYRAEAIEKIGKGVQELVLNEQAALVNSFLRRAVRGNPEVTGAYLENSSGEITLEIGELSDAILPGDQDSENHSVISVNTSNGHWGDIGIEFRPVRISSIQGLLRNPLARLAFFFGLAGFLLYEFYLRRVLRHLDPTAVMPERVRTIMDALAEGVVLIDEKSQIVMANISFSQTVELDIRALPGRDLSSFQWRSPGDSEVLRLPWEAALESGVAREDILITLTIAGRGHRYFSLNVTPILDDDDNVKGALATFDDQTEIVQKNNELKKALKTLSAQQAEIELQNEELRQLATRDPLTGCLNRRAFFDIFEKEFLAARNRFKTLSCIMCDIDHFKSVNDTYGHSVGDKVIQQMAECIAETVRENDHVCRYGGEEFCVLLPGLDAAGAAQVAERIRGSIEAQAAQKLRLTGDRKITASFGVTDLSAHATDLAELIDQADSALYRSKDSGRNQVSVYDPVQASEQASEQASAASA